MHPIGLLLNMLDKGFTAPGGKNVQLQCFMYLRPPHYNVPQKNELIFWLNKPNIQTTGQDEPVRQDEGCNLGQKTHASTHIHKPTGIKPRLRALSLTPKALNGGLSSVNQPKFLCYKVSL